MTSIGWIGSLSITRPPRPAYRCIKMVCTVQYRSELCYIAYVYYVGV